MGTIVERKRANGSTAYMAKIILKREGRIVHRESKTFDRRPAARAWLEKREDQLREPGALEREAVAKVTLADAIDRYIGESAKAIGKTKAQCLGTIRRHELAATPCEEIDSATLVAFARELSRQMQPQTVGNYMSHLASIFAIARPAWNYPLDRQAMTDAVAVMRRLGLSSKSKARNRRPSVAELDQLMSWFEERHSRRPDSVPMHRVIAFALFSTRRQEEITRIRWEDLDEANSRVLVRDMKNPGEKIGNDVWCDLPPEALAIIGAAPRTSDRIFPYSTDAITASFTRTCKIVGIEDLHFHDLRHEGVTRLFEMGWNIPHVAAVSGHRSWTSLKRYTHIRQAGDRWAGWHWLDRITKKPGR